MPLDILGPNVGDVASDFTLEKADGESVCFTMIALTIAEPVATWLQVEPRCLRVHSVFPRTINLVGDDGQLLTLLARSADNGPFALRLPCHHLPDVPVGTSAHAARGTLALGPLCVNWQLAIRWDPTLKPLETPPNSLAPSLNSLHRSDSVFAQALLTLSPGFMLPTYPTPPGLSANQRIRTLHPVQVATCLAALCAGLQGDDAALADAVHALLGFGEGLTPAGDDCLLGVLAARRMLGQPAGVLEATIRSSASRTTFLSTAFLQAACEAQFAGHWHRLREALESGGAAEIERAACHMLAYGATSGADALVGWAIGQFFHQYSTHQHPDPTVQSPRTG